MVERAGLDFHPVKGDAQALVSSGGLSEAGSNPVRFFTAVRQTFVRIAQDYAEAFSAPSLLDSDVIINQLPGSLFGYDLAEKLRIPHLGAAVMPLARTGAWPLCLLPAFSLGSGYNRLTYALAEQFLWGIFRKTVNTFRAELGLPPAPFMGHFRKMQAERMPILNGFSGHVVPRPPDWGDHIHVTGYWTLDEPAWTPAPDLLNFLNAGTPPVFIGFGSMVVADPTRLTGTVVQAVEMSGQRAILSAGWSGLAEGNLPDTIFKAGYTPYSWLFPRMAGIVHHGGSGTTGLALRSGVPSMIVPFLADQFYWGRRIAELGVSPGPIPYKKLAAEPLAQALRRMVTDTTMQAKAAALGEKIRLEKGIENAVQIIEQVMKR
jgi:sterol 3beta-glucosyltransferase